jgi:BirA family biotin operon repressor/biotin-[acetyl-CoA-carboxylase] ligase
VRAALERAADRHGSMACHIHWFEATGSTNDVAAHLAESGAPEGTVVVAQSQSSGRGRLGRTWFSPAGAGLYVSVVLRPAYDLAGASSPTGLLTLGAGVAIAEAIRYATGLPAEIKWPNDVLVNGRKLAGILAEAAAQAGALQYVVLGFGINLQPAAYPPDLAARATSIEAETSRAADRGLILSEVLAALNNRYGDLRAGNFDAILGAWRSLAPSLRSGWVEWNGPRGLVRGRAEDIDEHGALLVRTTEGIERVVSGEVIWKCS